MCKYVYFKKCTYVHIARTENLRLIVQRIQSRWYYRKIESGVHSKGNMKFEDNQNPPDNARAGCLNPERAWSGVMSAGALRRHLSLEGTSSS